MWTYRVVDGDLFLNDAYEGRGYSGNGKGKDNPSWEHIANVGPIPRGLWQISRPIVHAHLAPPVLRLTPAPGTDTFGRDGFLIHGDKIVAPGTASHGCIILGPAIRKAIAASADKTLQVV
jgi:hypothetical protein